MTMVSRGLESAANYHMEMANDIRVKLIEKLKKFNFEQREMRKAHHAIADKSLKAKQAQTSIVMKVPFFVILDIKRMDGCME